MHSIEKRCEGFFVKVGENDPVWFGYILPPKRSALKKRLFLAKRWPDLQESFKYILKHYRLLCSEIYSPF